MIAGEVQVIVIKVSYCPVPAAQETPADTGDGDADGDGEAQLACTFRAFTRTPEDPPGLVTVMLYVPATRPGVVAVIWPEFTTVTDVIAWLPAVTPAPAWKPTPETVTEVAVLGQIGVGEMPVTEVEDEGEGEGGGGPVAAVTTSVTDESPPVGPLPHWSWPEIEIVYVPGGVLEVVTMAS